MNAYKPKQKTGHKHVNRGDVLSNVLLLRLYEDMLKIRLCEESLVQPILDKRIRCPVHLYTGQEAVAAGVCAALTRRDYVFGNHRSHGHYLAKGGNLDALVAEVYGKTSGCSRGRGGSMHVIDPVSGFLGSTPIVAGTISLAVGAALASRVRRDRRVTVSFFGDGAADEGVFYESLNLAALYHLPVLFVCENNLYSTHLPIRECRADLNIAKTAAALGITSWRTDGNDVLVVYKKARSAVALCRQGKGPVFIECLTYRMRGHVGPDDDVQGLHYDIRPKAEIARWRKRDPIQRMEQWLVRRRLAKPADLDAIRRRLMQTVRTAHIRALKTGEPRANELFDNVFQ